MATIQIRLPRLKSALAPAMATTTLADEQAVDCSDNSLARWRNPVLEFGSYVGDANGGEVEIMAKIVTSSAMVRRTTVGRLYQ